MAAGHTVEWFSASFPGASAVEELDGIQIVRAGRQWTVHWNAFVRYRGSLRARFDVVIDEVNTMPFFTPIWAGIPTLMLIFQLAREVWWYESPFPISAAGYAIEPIYLLAYRDTPVLTISKSTEQGFAEARVQSANHRLSGWDRTDTARPIPAVDNPNIPYTGRLASSKRVGHILRAFAQFRHLTGAGICGWSEAVRRDIGDRSPNACAPARHRE